MGQRRQKKARRITKRSLRIQATIDRILAAPNLSYRQHYRLNELKKRRHKLSGIQNASLKRYKIKQTYRSKVTEDLLEFHAGGRGVRQLDIFMSMLHIPAEANLEQNYNNPVMKGRDEKYVVKVGYLQRALAAANLFDLQTCTFISGSKYGKPTLGPFISFLVDNPEAMDRLLNKKINQKHLKERIASHVRSLLNIVGLLSCEVRRNNGAGKAMYKLEPKRLKLMIHMVRKRERLFYAEDEAAPPETWKNEVSVDWEAAEKAWKNVRI